MPCPIVLKKYFNDNDNFGDPASIATYVNQVVPTNIAIDDEADDDDEDPRPLTFHWRQYDNKGRKGSYEHPVLLQILTIHLQAIALADTSWFDASSLVQALVLSLVAHECGLAMWHTGSLDEVQQKARMNEENWGEAAMSYFNAVTQLKDNKWKKILEAVSKYVTVTRARRSMNTRPNVMASRQAKAREVVEISDDK
ncbi:hypothetical protein OF83DRAFT_1174435 [Amylostereum chailletii]|nr:hypothetical protein OF83DRAFT_1174435 [Amylostereum chailletii]